MENVYNPELHDWSVESLGLKDNYSRWINEILNMVDEDGRNDTRQQIDNLISTLLRWVELSISLTDALLIAEYLLQEESEREQVRPGYADNYKEIINFALLNAMRNFKAAGIRSDRRNKGNHDR